MSSIQGWKILRCRWKFVSHRSLKTVMRLIHSLIVTWEWWESSFKGFFPLNMFHLHLSSRETSWRISNEMWEKCHTLFSGAFFFLVQDKPRLKRCTSTFSLFTFSYICVWWDYRTSFFRVLNIQTPNYRDVCSQTTQTSVSSHILFLQPGDDWMLAMMD